jgi:hypothetical protein
VNKALKKVLNEWGKFLMVSLSLAKGKEAFEEGN